MRGKPLPRPDGTQRPWSDELLVLFILRHLYKRDIDGEGPCTIHHISTLPGMPCQRDARIKRLMEMLCHQGMVTMVRFDQYDEYSISPPGCAWWEEHRSVMWFFEGMR